ncbi:dTDP-glucose 4,6-dehydratase [Bacillus sp. JJ634]
MGKHLLVTGGAGFIGANFIEYVLKHSNYHITNVDLLTYAGNLDNTSSFQRSNRYRFIQADIGNSSEVVKVFDQNYHAIVNFAAESHVDRSIEDAFPFIHTNIYGTYNLLQAVLLGKAQKMLQISTDEVYGSLGMNDSPFTETTSLTPNNPYSASKASADLLVRSYFNTYQLPLIITRCSNNYGPMQHEEKFIPKVITNAFNHSTIPVYGDGLNIRDWIYVEDHCRAIHMVLEKGEFGEVYNIGGLEEKTNVEIVKLILNHLGIGKQLIRYIPDRKGHDRRYAMDSTKILRELGWLPRVSLNEGIQRTIEWYRNAGQKSG